jgi:uncharacterized membrane protein YwaF
MHHHTSDFLSLTSADQRQRLFSHSLALFCLSPALINASVFLSLTSAFLSLTSADQRQRLFVTHQRFFVSHQRFFLTHQR